MVMELPEQQAQFFDEAKSVLEKLLELLRYEDSMNSQGGKPSYSDIGQHFRLSKPTVRTRVKQLVDTGTVKEAVHGRSKVLELTEEGKNYMAV